VLVYDDKTRPQGGAYFAAKKYLVQIAPDLVNGLVPAQNFDLASDEWGQQLVAPYDPERSSLVIRDNQIWGVVGEYTAEVKQKFKLPDFTAGFEVHIDMLRPRQAAYKPLSKYPSSQQDITLQVAAELSYVNLEACLKSELNASEYNYKLRPIGIYQKEPEAKNITFRVTLSHHDQTLTTQEVNELIEKLTWQAHEQLGAEQV
jgi:phenylalanyl-tRNA synthetase beta chain